LAFHIKPSAFGGGLTARSLAYYTKIEGVI